MILSGEDPAAIRRAAEVLRAGGLVGLPTETVYGLAGDAENDAAARAIFVTKGRPAEHPLIVHVTGAEKIARFASTVPGFARVLVDAFWPGPLTIIVPRQRAVASVAAGGNATIALRCPSHPVARELLVACVGLGVHGLAAPSANRFGRVSPTTAQHVEAEFGSELLTLDGGACAVGIESTIVDCTRGVPVLLRPGRLTRPEIERALGQRLRNAAEVTAPDPKASGTLPAHYAPRARVRLMDADALGHAAAHAVGAEKIAIWARTPLPDGGHARWIRAMPRDAAAAAHELFAVLRDFDAAGAGAIWVETPPEDPAWEGVRDRLQRAAAAG